MNLTVSSSPHIKGNDSTRRIMRDVVLAALPALIFGIVHFGVRALLVTLSTVAAALAGAWIATNLDVAVLRKPFGVYLLLSGVSLLWPQRRKKQA